MNPPMVISAATSCITIIRWRTQASENGIYSGNHRKIPENSSNKRAVIHQPIVKFLAGVEAFLRRHAVHRDWWRNLRRGSSQRLSVP